jgi:hypothetical protein
MVDAKVIGVLQHSEARHLARGPGRSRYSHHADVFTSPSIQQAQRETTGDLGSFFGFLNPKMKKWNFTWEIVDKLEVAKLGKERR